MPPQVLDVEDLVGKRNLYNYPPELILNTFNYINYFFIQAIDVETNATVSEHDIMRSNEFTKFVSRGFISKCQCLGSRHVGFAQ